MFMYCLQKMVNNVMKRSSISLGIKTGKLKLGRCMATQLSGNRKIKRHGTAAGELGTRSSHSVATSPCSPKAPGPAVGGFQQTCLLATHHPPGRPPT